VGHHQKKPVCFAHEKNPQETSRMLRKASCPVSQAPEGAQFTEESHGMPCPLCRFLLDILAMRSSFFRWKTDFNFRYCESIWYCKSYDNMNSCADNWRFVWYFTRRLDVCICCCLGFFFDIIVSHAGTDGREDLKRICGTKAAGMTSRTRKENKVTPASPLLLIEPRIGYQC
jgi:hypothetical protein